MTDLAEIIESDETSEENVIVTFSIADHWFGIPIMEVLDVFIPQSITRVPLAPKEVGGVLNLRGRIVTAIDLRPRLGFPPREGGAKPMAIGIERGSESYGLIIDEIGEVLSIEPGAFERNPDNLDAQWRETSKGVYRLQDKLLIVLDVKGLISTDRARPAA